MTNVQEKVERAVQNAMLKIKDWKACNFDMLPDWMRSDNLFVLIAYSSGSQTGGGVAKYCFRVAKVYQSTTLP